MTLTTCPLSPGAKEDDYKVDPELNKIIVDESRDKETSQEEGKVEVGGGAGEEEAKTTIGSIRYSKLISWQMKVTISLNRTNGYASRSV